MWRSGASATDYVLIEERGIVGGSFHETAARENFPRARTDELLAGRRGESFAERSFLEALAAEVTSCAKKARWDSADSIHLG